MADTVNQHHDEIQLTAGDDWTINGTLLDEAGAALDQTDATHAWALIDPDGFMMPAVEGLTITPVEPVATSGKCIIVVPRALTETITKAGRYRDALRVTESNGKRSRLWTGPIAVDFDLFQSEAPA